MWGRMIVKIKKINTQKERYNKAKRGAKTKFDVSNNVCASYNAMPTVIFFTRELVK